MFTHMLRTALLLGVFALIGTALVALTFDRTREPIAESEKQALLRSLHALVPDALHDNDMYTDTTTVTDREYLGTSQPLKVYRARQQDQPVAAVMEAVAPDGYSGSIRLLIAVHYEGTLLGVRVTRHRETPGLGDAIEIERSDWITDFTGKSLDDPDEDGWAVEKDGGDFDQFTGATITPRAIVKAVHRALQYYQAHRDSLFSTTNKQDS